MNTITRRTALGKIGKATLFAVVTSYGIKLSTNKSKAFVIGPVEIIAAMLLIVGGAAIYALWRHCQNTLRNPAPPPPNHHGAPPGVDDPAVSRNPASPAFLTSESFTPPQECFGVFTVTTPRFLSPDRFNYYTGLMAARISTSVGVKGYVKIWLSPSYIRIIQYTASLVVVADTTLKNWKDKSFPMAKFVEDDDFNDFIISPMDEVNPEAEIQ